jgi:hypothetical protein
VSANTVEASLPPAVGCYRRRAASSTRHHRRLCPFLRAVPVAATAASVAILDHPFISSAWCHASACLHPQARAQLLLQQLPPPSASTYCGSSYFLLRMWLSSALVASRQPVIASLRPPHLPRPPRGLLTSVECLSLAAMPPISFAARAAQPVARFWDYSFPHQGMESAPPNPPNHLLLLIPSPL